MTLTLWIMTAVLLVLLALGLLVSVRGSRAGWGGRPHAPGYQHDDGRYVGYDSGRQFGNLDGGADGVGGDGADL
jgi:hypothetical protein